MARYEMRDTRYEIGSALILAVVLTSLLAIVGVMFVMVARVDRMATSAISENKELNFAVETVVAKISQVLVLDVPGLPGQEYYDYPDANNAWLASLEPYDSGGYKWRQISDVTGFLADNNYDTDDVDVKPVGLNTLKYVREYPEIRVNSDGKFLDKNGNIAHEGLSADADGDGVADSKWIELEGINSNKGKPIYAAIRVIDNGGMLNVNTVFADPGGFDERKGDMLTDIYIDGLVKTGTNYIDKFIKNRSGDPTITETAAEQYHTEVSRRVENPAVASPLYTLYDISDELSLRNRFIAYNKPTVTRLESKDCFGNSLRNNNAWTPVNDSDAFKSWERHVDPDHPDNLGLDPNESDNLYSFRKLLTTYNFDRIINPEGKKMLNVNDPTVGAGSLYNAIRAGLYDANLGFADVNDVAAQITVNMIDYRDNDSDVTDYNNPDDGKIYYGFERPCVYISELAHRFLVTEAGGGPPPSDTWRSYAVELYKPYTEDAEPNNWRLFIDNSAASPPGDVIVPVDWSSGSQRFHVIRWGNTFTELYVDPCASSDDIPNLYNKIFDNGSIISLQRRVDDVNNIWISVDSHVVPDSGSSWLVANDGTAVSIQRDITLHKCIRRLWASESEAGSPELGQDNTYSGGGPDVIQAHPANKDFTNIGEIGMLFRKGAYYQDPANRNERIGYGGNKTEEEVRLNLADPVYQNLFQYLTVTAFDPTDDGIDNDGDDFTDECGTPPVAGDELKIPGRININTVPWYVIAQLPWVSDELAQAIVAYRDKLDLSPGGPDYYHSGANDSREQETGIEDLREEPSFASIGELNFVFGASDDDYSVHYYALDSNDLRGFPDLTPGGSTGDEAPDDFEERDVIFARISNLVTVRSDVFTAYILVRIGTDGPQKRVIAILDRSDVYPPGGGKVRIVALHPVPDPR